MTMFEKIAKPWGHEVIWAKTPRYMGKILVINKGHRLSLQYHEKKDESILLAKGLMELEVEGDGLGPGRQKIVLKPGDSYHIPPRLKHRMTALEDCEVIEVSTPELDDVVRLEDDYDRAKC